MHAEVDDVFKVAGKLTVGVSSKPVGYISFFNDTLGPDASVGDLGISSLFITYCIIIVLL